MIPLDSSVEAEYADGYIHSETEREDVSPYDPAVNILNDIINKRPEEEHGSLVRFSVFYKNKRYDVDWKDLPDNARPIRFRDRYSTVYGDGTIESGCTGVHFGYQYNDEDGNNHKEIIDLN